MMSEPIEPSIDAAHLALFELDDALNKDFQRTPDWSKDVMSAAERLCAVIDSLRHKIDGGRLQ